MKHNTTIPEHCAAATSSDTRIEEFDVFLRGHHIIFGWSSKDISEIAHTLGEPEIDLEPCG